MWVHCGYEMSQIAGTLFTLTGSSRVHYFVCSCSKMEMAEAINIYIGMQWPLG